MSLAPRKRTRATTVSPEAVEQAASFLEELPDKPKEDLSLREAVGQMQDSLKAALAKGYSYEELAQMLGNQGIQISAFTLKNYVPSGKRSLTKGKPRKNKKDEAETMAEIEELNLPTEEAPAEAKPARGRRASATKSTPAKSTTSRRRKQP
jgi:hypothetical protein